MSDQKDNQFQYQRFDNNENPRPTAYNQDFPITPPPYTPYPDHNSYVPNPANTGFNGEEFTASQPVFVQPMPAFLPVNTGPEMMRTSYGTIVQTVPQTVIFIGSCPACRVGILEDDFTCLGILLAILFFPLGILCCLALRERRCPNCGATFE